MATYLDLLGVANNGGGMIIDAKRFNFLELNSLVTAASKKGSKIIIRNASSLKALDLHALSNVSKGCVIFDFCN